MATAGFIQYRKKEKLGPRRERLPWDVVYERDDPQQGREEVT
jgi:hypothetical protein